MTILSYILLGHFAHIRLPRKTTKSSKKKTHVKNVRFFFFLLIEVCET